ncbi:MAG: amino acid adenylation domain-containing protein, partial [Acidobacteriota bacterium]
MMETHSNIVKVLRWRASYQAERLVYLFLADGEREEEQFTYADLDRRARIIGAALQQRSAMGERVLLIYPPGLEYIAAFMGCLYAGAIAVPTYPARHNRTLPRLQAIVKDACARIALTTNEVASTIAPLIAEFDDLKNLDWITTDTIAIDILSQWCNTRITTNMPAFLQYTSGSTSTPKGVVVTHANLIHNQQMIQKAFQHTESSTFVGWLPLYHDMGLIGNVVQPLFIGASSVLMSPLAFLQNPLRWLKAISRYRAATSGGPNFAYDLCVRKISAEQCGELDLSCWTTAFNGSEPIRYETIEAFNRTFSDYGFRQDAFYPCYGLAEATLFVAGSSEKRCPVTIKIRREALEQNLIVTTDDESNAVTLVSCGEAHLNQRIVIVEPQEMKEVTTDRVGEIWVAGTSIASQYWQKSQESKITFQAYLVDTNEGPFLRTGDLGFVHNGELYITGRLKDLIIIRGHNHYPQDIELTVEHSNTHLRSGCGAAFTVEVNGQENLVCVQELQSAESLETESIITDIRQAIAEEHELQVFAICLIKPGTIPKTSSGKVQRYACKKRFLHDELDIVTQWRIGDNSNQRVALFSTRFQNLTEIEQWLCAELSARVGCHPTQIDINEHLTVYGVDSLAAIEMIHRLEVSYGITLPITSFLENPQISQLAAKIFSAATCVPLQPYKEQPKKVPLSCGQRALFFLHQLNPTSPAYNIANAVRINSRLDINLFVSTLEHLIERHSVLRTTFALENGKLIQCVHEKGELFFHHEEITNWSEAAINECLLREAHTAFDLKKGPLIRFFLYTRSQQEHLLLLVIHHIISDFWSLAVLLRELQTIYSISKRGKIAVLPNLQFNFSDYLNWQEDMLTGPEGERLWSYWREQLSSELPILNLPVDHPRPKEQTYRGASLRFKLDEKTTQKLRVFSQERDVTLYMTLLAVFQGLLYRYTGQNEIIVGSLTSGRSRAEFADLIGYFVNPIVLRINFSGSPNFEKLLLQVRKIVLAAFEHQDFPFTLLVERLQPERDLTHTPLFQLLFVMHKVPQFADPNLAALAIGETGVRLEGEFGLEAIPLQQQVAQFDLSFIVAEIGENLCISLQYNIDLFEQKTIERMADHYNRLLKAVISDPTTKLAQQPLLTIDEERKLLREWNNTEKNYYLDTCLHHLFEAQVERTPDAIAVIYENETLSYRELNKKANRLAHYLRNLGVRADTPVAICAERSVQMIVGLIGILKAGGAYLPIDPDYPPERQQFMLSDAQPPIIIKQLALNNTSTVELTDQQQLICIDADWHEIDQHSAENPESIVDSDNLAYIIYTSGSTGNPKGVMNTHRAICNRLLWMQDAFKLTYEDRVLQKTPFSFDVSVWEFFWPLITGASLVIARPGGHRNGDYLIDIIGRAGITNIHFVPSMLQAFLTLDLSTCRSLKRVICSGEALSAELQERFFALLPAELHNLYGPTEAAVDVTAWACLNNSKSKTVPIGCPIANIEIYLLDHNLQCVPIGVSGELYIGGVGLARGYFNRADLTAERFIPHPFSKNTGERLYKTGDLARYLPDGNIEFLGRLDDQVKIRGFRIELGEIEAALNKYPAIQEAVVLAREDSLDNRRLVAYLVWQDYSHPSVNELRTFLKTKLPEYMVPAAFVTLEEMPLTPNGKLNRRILSTLAWEQSTLVKSFVPPRNWIEATLVEIWTATLGIAKIGVRDNFFTLGGDSIRSIQVKSRAQERGINFSLQQLFEHQTIEALAVVTNGEPLDVVTTHQPFSLLINEDRQKLPIDIEDAYPLTKLQMGLIYHSEHSADYENYITSLHLRTRFDADTLLQALRELIIRHAILRTSFDLTSYSEPLQLIHCEVAQTLLFEDLRNLSIEEQNSVISARLMEVKKKKFDWGRTPLFSLHVYQRDEDSFQLTLSEPFLDGWSVATLLTELLTDYCSLLQQKELYRSPLSTTFRDYVALERKALNSPECLKFWSEKLNKYKPSRLPRSPRTAILDTLLIKRIGVPITEEISNSLKNVSALASVPLKSVLLAAHLRVISSLVGETDIITGLLYNGRPETTDGDRVLGLFLNAVPLRVEIDSSSTWKELAQYIFELEHELLPYRRYPLAEIQRIRGGGTFFDTAFNFTHFHIYQYLQEINELEILHAYASDQTYFDLTAQFNLDHHCTTPLIKLWLDYRNTEIGEDLIEIISKCYERVLVSVVTNFDTPIRLLPPLTIDEELLLQQWRGVSRPAVLETMPVIDIGATKRLAQLEAFLAEQEQALAWRQSEYIAPTTPIEEKLIAVWQQVLGIERIGIHDNYFELGGDSIQCIQIVARARQAGLQITTNQMFEHPTVAELATVANVSLSGTTEQGTVSGLVLLTPIQHWFFEQQIPVPHHWNQAVMLAVKPDVDPELLQKAFQHLLDHHDALRLRFTKDTQGWHQVNDGLGKKAAFDIVNLSLSSESSQI